MIDDLPVSWREALPQLGVSHLLLGAVVMVGLLELVWLLVVEPSRTGPRRTAMEAAAAAMAGIGGLVIGGLTAGLFALVFDRVGRLAPTGLGSWWATHPVIAVLTAFVAWDLVGYVYHRIGHTTRLGWAAHRPHHTGTLFNLTLSWRQSWLPVHGIVLPLVALGGWSLSTIALCAAVSNLWQALQHSTLLPTPPRWLVAVLMTAEQHRHHHLAPDCSRRRPAAVNLGPVFTLWDRLAGTHVAGPVALGSRYGEPGTPGSNPIRIQWDGWYELAVRRTHRVV
jgi:alkylglycerol monooxygenase